MNTHLKGLASTDQRSQYIGPPEGLGINVLFIAIDFLFRMPSTLPSLPGCYVKAKRNLLWQYIELCVAGGDEISKC